MSFAVWWFAGLVAFDFATANRDEVIIAHVMTEQESCEALHEQLPALSKDKNPTLRCSSCMHHKNTTAVPDQADGCINFLAEVKDFTENVISVVHSLSAKDVIGWSTRDSLSSPIVGSDVCRVGQIMHQFYHDLKDGVAEADEKESPFSNGHDAIHWIRDICLWFRTETSFDENWKVKGYIGNVKEKKASILADTSGVFRDAIVEALKAHVAALDNDLKTFEASGPKVQLLWEKMTPRKFVTLEEYTKEHTKVTEQEDPDYTMIANMAVLEGTLGRKDVKEVCCSNKLEKVFNPMDHYRKDRLQCQSLLERDRCE